jgi:hypothetical protein
MQRKLLAFVSAAALLTALFVPLGTSAHANPDNNPSTAECLGVERGIRNQNGGDREHGAFGPGQSDVVRDHQPYGQWLQGWKDDNCGG